MSRKEILAKGLRIQFKHYLKIDLTIDSPVLYPHLILPNSYVIGIWHNRSTNLRKARYIDYGLEFILYDYSSLLLCENDSFGNSKNIRAKLKESFETLDRTASPSIRHKLTSKGTVWYVNYTDFKKVEGKGYVEPRSEIIDNTKIALNPTEIDLASETNLIFIELLKSERIIYGPLIHFRRP